jgi:glycosyltransferase involved in cell wall biosynthesis
VDVDAQTRVPPVSVVVRSFNRLDAVAALLPLIQAQTYADFELVVVEQSTQATADQRAALAAIAAGDPRVRIYRFPPLGGPRSRNESARVARGDVIVFIDDDDLPGGPTWLTRLLAPLADPDCLAVTGGDRLEGEREEVRPYWNPDKAERRVMSLDVFRWQRVFSRARVTRRVESLRGGNIAVRRTTLERFGLWDECTPVEDDVGIAYRINAGKRPEEYLFFDGDAYQIRRLGVAGGMAKRKSSTYRYAEKVFTFLHNVVAHYHPVRFALLYPGYVYLNAYQTIDWVWADTGDQHGKLGKIARTAWIVLAMIPWHLYWVPRWWVRRLRGGPLAYAPTIAPTETTRAALATWGAPHGPDRDGREAHA